jgi:hypothetical protein
MCSYTCHGCGNTYATIGDALGCESEHRRKDEPREPAEGERTWNLTAPRPYGNPATTTYPLSVLDEGEE